METKVTSNLCNEWFAWQGPLGCLIRFHEDGLGDLRCGYDLHTFICAQFAWKFLETPQTDLKPANNDINRVEVVLKIEMTLLRQPIPDVKITDELCWGSNLTEDAFRPKGYTITLSKGKFDVREYYHGGDEEEPIWYGRRISFDKSPYPPLDEWARAKRPAELYKFWEHTEFFADMDKERFKITDEMKEIMRERRERYGIGLKKEES